MSPGLQDQNALLRCLWYEGGLDGNSSLWDFWVFFLMAQGGAELIGRVTGKVTKHRIVSLWLYSAGMRAVTGNGEGPQGTKGTQQALQFFSANRREPVGHSSRHHQKDLLYAPNTLQQSHTEASTVSLPNRRD